MDTPQDQLESSSSQPVSAAEGSAPRSSEHGGSPVSQAPAEDGGSLLPPPPPERRRGGQKRFPDVCPQKYSGGMRSPAGYRLRKHPLTGKVRRLTDAEIEAGQALAAAKGRYWYNKLTPKEKLHHRAKSMRGQVCALIAKLEEFDRHMLEGNEEKALESLKPKGRTAPGTSVRRKHEERLLRQLREEEIIRQHEAMAQLSPEARAKKAEEERVAKVFLGQADEAIYAAASASQDARDLMGMGSRMLGTDEHDRGRELMGEGSRLFARARKALDEAEATKRRLQEQFGLER